MAKNLSRWMFSRSPKISSSSSSRTFTTTAAAVASEETTSTTSMKHKVQSLYRRLSALGGDPKVNLGDILNEWEEKEGQKLHKSDIIGFVNSFRKYKRHPHALQLLEWLEKKGQNMFSPAYHAIRLSLLSKTEGVESAEKYFASLPESTKDRPIYGALLHCYCKNNLKEKAMEIFEKMKELNFANTLLTYNSLMTLCMTGDEPEKVPLLLNEMKEKNIKPDLHTYNQLMMSYASLKDMEGLDGILEEMNEANIKCDWTTYTTLSTIYIKAGIFDKANSTLEKLEKMDDLRDRKAYNLLINLYAQTSNKSGVKRVWESLKSTFQDTTNMCYLAMLQALSKLGETDELQKCFKEWESSCTNYDLRVAYVLVDSYLSQGMIKEANSLLDDAMKRGDHSNMRKFETFMRFYLKQHQMDLALEYFEAACSEEKHNIWHPSQESVSMFLKHFEEEKNVAGAERFYRSLKIIKCLNSEAYSSLLRTYIAAGLTNVDMRQRAKEDGIKLSHDIENLLETVCPE